MSWAPPVAKLKHTVPSNFTFEIGSLRAARVNKVDSLTIKQTVVKASASKTKHPTKLEIPNIKVTFAAGTRPQLDKLKASGATTDATLKLRDASGKPWLTWRFSGVKVTSVSGGKAPVATLSATGLTVSR